MTHLCQPIHIPCPALCTVLRKSSSPSTLYFHNICTCYPNPCNSAHFKCQPHVYPKWVKPCIQTKSLRYYEWMLVLAVKPKSFRKSSLFSIRNKQFQILSPTSKNIVSYPPLLALLAEQMEIRLIFLGSDVLSSQFYKEMERIVNYVNYVLESRVQVEENELFLNSCVLHMRLCEVINVFQWKEKFRTPLRKRLCENPVQQIPNISATIDFFPPWFVGCSSWRE